MRFFAEYYKLQYIGVIFQLKHLDGNVDSPVLALAGLLDFGHFDDQPLLPGVEAGLDLVYPVDDAPLWEFEFCSIYFNLVFGYSCINKFISCCL